MERPVWLGLFAALVLGVTTSSLAQTDRSDPPTLSPSPMPTSPPGAITPVPSTPELPQTPSIPPAAKPPATGGGKAISWKEGDNCVQNTRREADIELKSGRHPAGPDLLSTSYFLPAGSAVDAVLTTPFQEGTHYFGYIERVDDPSVRQLLGRGFISMSKLTEDHPLVKKGEAGKDDTLLKVRIPDILGGPWKRATLYVYACRAPGTPKSVSQLTMHVSSTLYSGLIVWPAIMIVYLLAALASKAADQRSAPWYRYLDPVYMTAGTDGKGSLSKLQILFFSMIVVGLLSFIVARMGVLSDLSSSILLLLGITGLASTAAKGTDAVRNRLSSENEAWLIDKNWLPSEGWAATNRARWHDIIASEGEFDVYRYQSCIFSVVVGVSLLAAGINELSSFTIPETLLGVLGLSQAVYIGGKVVAPTSIGELNDAVTELRQLENAFGQVALSNPDLDPTLPGGPLDIAKRRAPEPYLNYINKVRTVRILFQKTTGRAVGDVALEPSPPQ